MQLDFQFDSIFGFPPATSSNWARSRVSCLFLRPTPPLLLYTTINLTVRYGSLANGLTDGLDIRFGSVVTDVRYTPTPSSSANSSDSAALNGSNGVTENSMQVTLSDGTTVDGDAVLMTVPLGVLKKSTFPSPSLPLSPSFHSFRTHPSFPFLLPPNSLIPI